MLFSNGADTRQTDLALASVGFLVSFFFCVVGSCSYNVVF
jgi:hypothetical protein